MFKRLLWLIIGASFGFGISWWMTRTIRRTIEKWTPEELSRSAGALVRDLADAVTEVRVGMKEAERDLRTAITSGEPFPLLNPALDPRAIEDGASVHYLPPTSSPPEAALVGDRRADRPSWRDREDEEAQGGRRQTERNRRGRR